ncbi:MAG: hypothetical protein KGI23_03725 [Patescibacteria group bacterium]|nr:hypothetical protein [Patescibacteria group bacterium]
MEQKTQNHFNNPVVIILVIVLVGLGGYLIFSHNQNQNGSQSAQSPDQNSQQQEIDSLKQQVQNLTNTKSGNDSTKQLTSSDIAKEWRVSTAHVDCEWYYSNGTPIQEVSGSGLLATFNSIPTVVTNKHIVFSSTYGYAGRCSVEFPDDNGTYVYSNNLSWYPNYGSLTVDSNGGDVAYLSEIHWVHHIDITKSESVSDQVAIPPTLSLNYRSKSGSFVCSATENSGDPILVLGYPVYGPQANFLDSRPIEPTVTEGIISGKDGIYYTTSAKIDHGNSGGLAIDENNDCYFGIPTWNESGSFESLGRILPASTFLH